MENGGQPQGMRDRCFPNAHEALTSNGESQTTLNVPLSVVLIHKLCVRSDSYETDRPTAVLLEGKRSEAELFH